MNAVTCPDCLAAGQRAKAEGHRDWRTGYACYEHAAVDLDAFFAEIGYAPDNAEPIQPDLFA